MRLRPRAGIAGSGLAHSGQASRLPAIAAAQLGAWNQDVIQRDQGLAAALERVLAVLEEAKDVTP